MNTQRIKAIRQHLQHALAPQQLDVIDDSHHHIGHIGARDGRGHFTVHITSAAFVGLTPLARHRAVYTALSDLMRSDIHALSITACTPEEAGSA